jgi:hypothetical protein
MTSHRSLDAVRSIRRRAAFGPCARPVRILLGPATIGRFSIAAIRRRDAARGQLQPLAAGMKISE